MKKIIKKYWKVASFYLLVVILMMGVSIRFKQINNEIIEETYIIAEAQEQTNSK